MKIATFNVNGIKARLPRLLEWLEQEQPDVACLQELKSSDETFPEAEITKAGYGAIWHGQKGFNGVAILAKGEVPKERMRGLPGEDDDVQSRYLEAEIDDVVIASIYLPNGNPQPGPKFDYKLRWFERLDKHARGLLAEERPVVLAGDYNVCPEDRDAFSIKAMAHDALIQPESREAYRRLLHQGWLDSLRTIHPYDDKLYTFWDYQAGCWPRNAGLRIDHLLLSPQAADRLIDAQVNSVPRAQERASDHTPVWVQLRTS